MEFLEAVTRAEAEAELRMIAQWQAQIPRDWRAARDFLARRFPKRWGPNARVEVDHYGELNQFQKAPPTTEWLASDRIGSFSSQFRLPMRKLFARTKMAKTRKIRQLRIQAGNI